jgi:hypothetical protein
MDKPRPMRPLLLLSVVAVLLSVLLFSSPSRAQTEPWLGSGESSYEDRFADGDLDEEDLARIPAMPRRGDVSSDTRMHASSWLSIVGFAKEFPTGTQEIGVMFVIGVALDRVTSPHATILRPPVYFAQNATGPGSEPRLALEPALARGSVRAAWRTVGLEATDARIDAMIARSEASAVLPEARLRAMKTITGSDATIAIDSTGHTYETIGANLVLEARLTWRLDRLVYADDEASLERLRMERQEARSRLGTRVLELLFAWQRSIIEIEATTAGGRTELDAILRRCESEVSLDVLTGGWFSAQPAVRTAAATRGKSP